ncbi:hypothetical protein [Chachezhania sediminis]|uniref:hypothetical protein n=1 Tax=Chachezhania sediminis TaxID=2599291 RepID=UPI00131C0E67|nr:hypothetical protein [Chachezhania sediminis]
MTRRPLSQACWAAAAAGWQALRIRILSPCVVGAKSAKITGKPPDRAPDPAEAVKTVLKAWRLGDTVVRGRPRAA